MRRYQDMGALIEAEREAIGLTKSLYEVRFSETLSVLKTNKAERDAALSLLDKILKAAEISTTANEALNSQEYVSDLLKKKIDIINAFEELVTKYSVLEVDHKMLQSKHELLESDYVKLQDEHYKETNDCENELLKLKTECACPEF